MKQMLHVFHSAWLAVCLGYFTGFVPLLHGEPTDEETLASRQPETPPSPAPVENPPSETSQSKMTESAAPLKKIEPTKSSDTETASIAKKTEPMYSGRVMFVNLKKKFIILDFDNNQIPPVGSTMGVYRGGQFVGSFRITQPVNPPLASADILSGVLRRSDQVR